MQPIFDVDVLVLLATSLAAKRRPAELTEIMAAVDLIQGNIPTEDKLSEAFTRLGQHDLLKETMGCVELTETAEKMIEALPHKGKTDVRLFELKSRMAAYQCSGGSSSILFPPEQLRMAIQAHRAADEEDRKNLLVPKPTLPKGGQQRPGQHRRKPFPKSRHKR